MWKKCLFNVLITGESNLLIKQNESMLYATSENHLLLRQIIQSYELSRQKLGTFLENKVFSKFFENQISSLWGCCSLFIQYSVQNMVIKEYQNKDCSDELPNVCYVKIHSRLQNYPFRTISSHFFAK